MTTSKSVKIIGGVVIVIIVTFLILLLFEGFSSALLIFSELYARSSAPMAERKHTEYDSSLGWINVKNADIKDMYGEGVYLKTNSQRVRSDTDIPESVKPGIVRTVCSGDSFTFGYGVSNSDTWCAKLEGRDPRIETVNMGQGGYGLDQAYLWYKRDGARFKAKLNIFAFVTDDFKRVQKDNMYGYGKPLLSVKGGSLSVGNVPVPKRSYLVPFITRNARIISKFKSIELVRKILPQKKAPRASSDEETFLVVLKIFEEMKRVNDERGAKLITVYFPTENDYSGNRGNDYFRSELARELKSRGIPMLNLVDVLRSLPPGEIKSKFIQEGDIDYAHAAGHFNREGNAYMATLIYGELIRLNIIEPLTGR